MGRIFSPFFMIKHFKYTPTVFTKKLYYSKFPYKFVIRTNLRSSIYGGGISGKQANKIKEVINIIKVYIKSNITGKVRFNNWDCYSYNNDIFFENENDANLVYTYIVNSKVANVIRIFQPESDAQLALMKLDHTVIYRSTLFYKKYQYQVVLKKDNRYDVVKRKERMEFFDWLDTSDLNYRYSAFTVYLMEENDVVLIKLLYSSMVKSIYKAVIK